MTGLRVLVARSALVVLQTVGLLSAVAAQQTASLAAGEIEVVADLDVHVEAVLSGAHWCRGDQEGFYRVVVYSSGIEEVYHHLYVQLVRVDPEKGTLAIDRTIPVKEAQGLDLIFSGLTLTPATAIPCSDVLVTATASRRSIDGHGAERFRLRLGPTGDYRVTFETDPKPRGQD